MLRALRNAALAALLVTSAHAQTVGPQTKAKTTSPVTVTSTSAQVLAAGQVTQLLAIDNESSSATIACAFGGTAALNTAGSFTIAPQNTRVWNSAPIPNDAINCISSASTSPMTLEYN